MQIQILKPRSNGKHYPNYDEFIRNARSSEERSYLVKAKRDAANRALMGDDVGFAFGLVYVAKMACGHYELLQHPILREYGDEPTETDIINSLEITIEIAKKSANRKCTRCICNF